MKCSGQRFNLSIKAIGDKYSKSVAQVILHFLIQSDVVVIPKTISKERMIENFTVFDFTLTTENMAVIAGLDENESAFFSHYDSELDKYTFPHQGPEKQSIALSIPLAE